MKKITAIISKIQKKEAAIQKIIQSTSFTDPMSVRDIILKEDNMKIEINPVDVHGH